jgi:hypothetical protein
MRKNTRGPVPDYTLSFFFFFFLSLSLSLSSSLHPKI